MPKGSNGYESAGRNASEARQATVEPITLFDKSFLQSLSVDESVWFDRFFRPIVCPIFYVETLADLEKSVATGRTPEQEVGMIADKFPEMHGTPCAYHANLFLGSLMGHAVPMIAQIPMAGGRQVRSEGTTAVVYTRSPEEEAFTRWQKREFLEVERVGAKGWRDALMNLDLGKRARLFANQGISGRSCRTLLQARQVAEDVVAFPHSPEDLLRLAMAFQNIPEELQAQAIARWNSSGRPLLGTYAPYAAYVLTVDLFFHVALAANLISSQRPSNRIDIAYLYYLPFCSLFVSSDKLHRSSSVLFMRREQEFVWGGEMKSDLRRLNKHYLSLPDETRCQGVISFASCPPEQDAGLVASLWDRHSPGWRRREDSTSLRSPETQSRVLADANKLFDAPVVPESEEVGPEDVGAVAVQHLVHRKKGSWWQVPSDLED